MNIAAGSDAAEPSQSGYFTVSRNTTLLKGQFEAAYDLKALTAFAGPFLPQKLTMEGQRKGFFNFQSEYPTAQPELMAANLNGQGSVGFTSANFMGLKFGETQLNLNIKQGLMQFELPDSKVNQGTLRLAAQVGGDVVRRRLLQAAEARRPHLHQRGQVGNRGPHLGVVAPERLAACNAVLRESELADVERQRPALLLRQVRVADHRGAFQALVDDLLEREHAALARALGIGEIDRRRIHARADRAVAAAGRAVAAGAVLLVQRGRARQVRHVLGAARHGVRHQQRLGQRARLALDLRG